MIPPLVEVAQQLGDARDQGESTSDPDTRRLPLRKVLAGVLCAMVATVPAVAFAATNDNETNDVKQKTETAEAPQLRQAAKQKLDTAVKRAKADRKAELRAKRRKQAAAAAPVQASGASTAAPHLEAIAACESGGNPAAIGGGGAYRGKYQFDYGTWASVGGSGDPAAAPEAEQDKRAAMLYAQAGASPWPVCGQ